MSFQATIGPTLTHVGASRDRPLEIRDLGPGALDVSVTRGGDADRLGPGETTVVTDGVWLSSPSRAEIAVSDVPVSYVLASTAKPKPRPRKKSPGKKPTAKPAGKSRARR